MAAPTLLDYQYQFGDSGILLGNIGSVLPIYDVMQIQGLDIPPIRTGISARDGAHGAFISSGYMDQRTVILDGVVYCDPAQVESILNGLKSNFGPLRYNPLPFYYKHPAATQKLVNAKPIGFTCDFTKEATWGQITFQVQLAAEDPRAYSDSSATSLISGTAINVTNLGNIEYWPTLDIVVTTAAVTLKVELLDSGNNVLNTVQIGGNINPGTYILDMGQRRFYSDTTSPATGIPSATEYSTLFSTTRQFFYIAANTSGGARRVKFTKLTGTGAVAVSYNQKYAWL